MQKTKRHPLMTITQL